MPCSGRFWLLVDRQTARTNVTWAPFILAVPDLPDRVSSQFELRYLVAGDVEPAERELLDVRPPRKHAGVRADDRKVHTPRDAYREPVGERVLLPLLGVVRLRIKARTKARP